MLKFLGLSRTLRLQPDAVQIAQALHDLEAHLAKANDKRGLAMAVRLHNIAEDIATRHGDALGVDVAPLSGGGPKPPAN